MLKVSGKKLNFSYSIPIIFHLKNFKFQLLTIKVIVIVIAKHV